MTTTNKILIGVGGVAVLGLGIYLITRKPKNQTTTTTTTTNGNIPLQDTSTVSRDSLGTTIGNILTDIWATTRTNNSCNYNGPADPYTLEVNQQMASADVKTLQTRVSACSAEIKKVIDDSGGVDGILGNGTKTAYNMARKSCCINSPTT